MADFAFTHSFTVTLDMKRRPTLPAALLEEVRMAPGEQLVAHAGGDGTIVLETLEAAQARTRSEFREAFQGGPRAGSAVDGLLEDRRQQGSQQRVVSGEADPGQGAALLASLGL